MILEKCPKCGSSLNFSMDYCGGNPVIIYSCDNCNFSTFGEAYITDNKTTATAGTSMYSTSTECAYTTTYGTAENRSDNFYRS